MSRLGERLLALMDSHREWPYISIEHLEKEAIRLCGQESAKGAANKEPWKIYLASNDGESR